jgi:hypothetical protein
MSLDADDAGLNESDNSGGGENEGDKSAGETEEERSDEGVSEGTEIFKKKALKTSTVKSSKRSPNTLKNTTHADAVVKLKSVGGAEEVARDENIGGVEVEGGAGGNTVVFSLEMEDGIASEMGQEGGGDPEDNWPPLSLNLFKDWGTFLQLGVPGALSLMLEWGSYEMVAGIAGQLVRGYFVLIL